MRFSAFAFAVVLAAVAAVSAHAGTLAGAQVGFSADRTLVFDGHVYQGRMWTMPGVERHEQMIRGFDPVFILHADSPLGEIVLPQLHTTVEFVFPRALRILDERRLTRHPVGHAVINGIATTKYLVDETAPEGHVQGALWLSRDGIPMRVAGTFVAPHGHVSTVRWELSHVRIAPQPAALFEPPRGFSHLPAEAIGPLLGMQLKGARQQ